MTKLEKLRAGLYSFPVPGTCHAGWSEQNWIDFIDNRGRWHDA